MRSPPPPAVPVSRSPKAQKFGRIELEAGRAAAVVTDQDERISIGRGLFVLANAGVQDLLADRITLPVWSRTFQVLLTKPMETVPLKHLIGHASRTLALKAEAGNRVMISGGLPGTWDPERERGTALDRSIEANLSDAVSVFPAIGQTEVELADADHLESSAIDAIPVIDHVPGTRQRDLCGGLGWPRLGHRTGGEPAACGMGAQRQASAAACTIHAFPLHGHRRFVVTSGQSESERRDLAETFAAR